MRQCSDSITHNDLLYMYCEENKQDKMVFINVINPVGITLMNAKQDEFLVWRLFFKEL